MDRKMFEAGLQSKKEEMQKEAEAEAVDMHKKLKEAEAEAVDMHKKLKEAEKVISEVKGMPESGKEIAEDKLSFDQFKNWLKENGLAEKIPIIEEQINNQEIFYAEVAGKKFDRGQFFIEKDRLSGILKGFEVGCINFCEVVDTTEKGDQTSESVYVFEKLVKPLESKKGFKIWEKSGRERWTKLELEELLQRGVPVEPDEIDATAFENDWVKEESRILDQKRSAKRIDAGGMRLVFTDSRVDIPQDQKIVNKKGEIVSPKNESYIETVINNIRVISRAENIVLASYLFWKNGEYLARNTWEFNRDFVDHRDKKTNPPVSVASSSSNSDGLLLRSNDAGSSDGISRRRLSL